MEFAYTTDGLAEAISQVLRADLELTESTFLFRVRGIGREREFSLARGALQTLIESIQSMDLSDETALYTGTSYEIFLSEEGRLPSRRLREETIRLVDPESTLTYEVSPASDAYLLWLIAIGTERGALRDLSIGLFPGRSRLERLLTVIEEDQPTSVFDLIRAVSFRSLTLKLNSPTRQSIRRYQTATYSFLFHLAFNLDVALVPQRFLEELSRRGRISRMRRSKVEDLDPPRRTYNEDLVNHYLLAISTENPTVQFLSYYHVLEHFFETVFNDDLVTQIRGAITQPDFSYKRKTDVSRLINTIKRSLQIRSETITFSESSALRLTLSNFVVVSDLVEKLDEYEASLVDYYAGTAVSFSNGPCVDLRGPDFDAATVKLAQRIYATRNALVHSKEGDKARYTPFRDERALLMEIPLMRFVAEMVLLSDSQIT